MAAKRKQFDSRKKKTKNKKKKTSRVEKKTKVLRKQVLSFMRDNREEAFTCKQVGAISGLWAHTSNNKLKSVLDSLADEGMLEYLERGRYQYYNRPSFVIGKLQVNRNGSGYVIVEDGDDVYVPPRLMGKALSEDLVKVKVIKVGRKSGKPEGEIKEIIQRARTHFVGIIEESLDDTFFLIPDDPRANNDFYIPKQHLNGAKDGQKVIIEMINWDRKSPEGKVVQVLGDAGEHNTEMHAILAQYGFRVDFPVEVKQEAADIPESLPEEEIQRRRDIREILTLTIDPVDAKDFDDALSFRRLENGHYEIGVHIADVAFYVRPDTAIDKEAFRRATSVYLVDRTVPMLPEKLSNNLCSLRPNEDRFAYSIMFEMDDNAKIYDQWIGRTVIHSDYRFHYDEAQEVMDGEKEGPFQDELRIMNKIAHKLKADRLASGSIEFDSNEVKFELDELDRPVRVIKKIRRDAHKMIEDYMLLANRRIASFIFNLEKNPPLPSVYRIHDRPDYDKLQRLSELAMQFGHKIQFMDSENTTTNLNHLLKDVQGRPEQNVLETLAIRSMAKAIYSIQNIGHFGLGFEFYTHFTSPIRRYPDLLVHRILDAYQHKVYNHNPTVLEAQCKHCSEMERTAAEAERASIKFKQVEFLEDKVGKEFDGVISGVIEAGIFVELTDNLAEGFVATRNLEGDFFVHDADRYQMVGHSTGVKLQLGDPVVVEIVGTDLKRRTIDMKYIRKREEK